VLAAAARAGAKLRLAPFYEKYLSVEGLPVLSSAKVSDVAMREAANIVNQMLLNRQDVRRELIARGVRVSVMAPDEKTTNIPNTAT